MSSKTVRRIQQCFHVVATVGFILLIGTAFSCAGNALDRVQLLVQLGGALMMIGVGMLFGGLAG